MEREEKRGYARGTARVLHSSIALHPYVTDDSGQALGVSPNHGDLSYRGDFGGVKKLEPFSLGFRSCSENKPSYSWPPHLYEEIEKLQAKNTRNFYIRLIKFHLFRVLRQAGQQSYVDPRKQEGRQGYHEWTNRRLGGWQDSHADGIRERCGGQEGQQYCSLRQAIVGFRATARYPAHSRFARRGISGSDPTIFQRCTIQHALQFLTESASWSDPETAFDQNSVPIIGLPAPELITFIDSLRALHCHAGFGSCFSEIETGSCESFLLIKFMAA